MGIKRKLLFGDDLYASPPLSSPLLSLGTEAARLRLRDEKSPNILIRNIAGGQEVEGRGLDSKR
jgi:hypothetical protein